MPRNRAAAVVLHEGKLLVMYRKNDREYYTFPGGGVEPGETNEEATVREIREETSIDAKVERLIYELHHDSGDIHYYFLCSYLGGTPNVQLGTSEYVDNELGQDIHLPRWLSVHDISETTLYPLEVRDRLLADIKEGFSNEVTRFNLSVA